MGKGSICSTVEKFCSQQVFARLRRRSLGLGELGFTINVENEYHGMAGIMTCGLRQQDTSMPNLPYRPVTFSMT